VIKIRGAIEVFPGKQAKLVNLALKGRGGENLGLYKVQTLDRNYVSLNETL